MDLNELRSSWEEFAADDPLWFILSAPGKKHAWKDAEFMDTGRREIAGVLDDIHRLGVPLRRSRALDFGCGVGRLCQALGEHFEEVWGVDISTRMIKLANARNVHGDRVHYVLNDTDRLPTFADGRTDFVYSNLVLQHMRPVFARSYLHEFMRILAPGGVLVFQLPSHPATAAYRVRRRLRDGTPRSLIRAYHRMRYGSSLRVEIYGIEQLRVIELLEGNGGRVFDVQPDNNAAVGWVSRRYYVRKLGDA
jgi:SAM-dependent methyltransferase